MKIYFLYLMIYSFLGWMCESIFCSIGKKKIINSGFMSGPFCPIYGFGSLFIIILLKPFDEYPVLVFLLGIIITSLLEYFTSWLMELCFHVMWWDYSNHKYNIHGRVCLINSILFGVMAVVVTYFVHPPVESFVLSLPSNLLSIITMLFLIYFIIDFIASFTQLVSFSQDVKQFEAAVQKVFEIVDDKLDIQQSMTAIFNSEEEHMHDLKEKLKTSFDQFINNPRYTHKHLKNAFPDLHLTHKKSELKHLMKYLKAKEKH